MRKTSFDLPDDLYRHASVAATAMGISTAEFIRAAITASLATVSGYSPAIAGMLKLSDEAAQQREKVNA